MYYWALITESLLRLGLAYAGIFVLLPRLLFSQASGEGFLDSFWADLVRMVCLTQVAVYVLAALRLYEVISLSVLYALLMLWRFRRLHTPDEVLALRVRLAARALDIMDGLMHPVRHLRPAILQVASRLRWMPPGRAAPARVAEFLLLPAVMGYAAYLRYSDALTNAAPAMSDSYVTLAWMKYVENRQLFHDGIYPQGFHIVLSVLRKFSAIESLLTLKYTGPLNSCLTTLSCYHFTSRMSGNFFGGLVSAFAYGCLPSLMPYEFDRQAATNSQEFAMLFLLPAMWSIVRYLDSGSRRDLFVVFSAAAVVGLTHAMVALFAACAALAAVVGALFSGMLTWGKTLRLFKAGLGAAAVSAAPVVVGRLFGLAFHGSSAEFAAAQGVTAVPQLQVVQVMVLGAGVTSALVRSLFARTRFLRAGLLSSAFFIAGSVLVYEAPRFGVSSLALASRAQEMYAVAMAVSLGLAISLLVPSRSPCRGILARAWSFMSRVGVVAVMVAALWYYPQTPAHPYKMQSNESAEQYLRILRTNRPTDWLIVSDFEGYSIVFGRGWHLMTGDFIGKVDPEEDRLAIIEDGRSTPIEVPWVYLFFEKTPYKPPIDAALPEFERKVRDMQGLSDWVSRYKARHGNLKVYYDGEGLTVYVIEQPVKEEDEFRRIWGDARRRHRAWAEAAPIGPGGVVR